MTESWAARANKYREINKDKAQPSHIYEVLMKHMYDEHEDFFTQQTKNSSVTKTKVAEELRSKSSWDHKHENDGN